MIPKKLPQLAQSTIIEELPAACADEGAAVDFLEAKRWAGCPKCPECESTMVYAMTDRKTGKRNRRYLWRCRECKRQFTVRTGTVYEESLLPLHKWCRVLWEASTCKNGVSALEISRKVQVTYKTALFMLHRVRHAMADGPATPKLSGTVEADETYVGGRPRYRRVGITGNHPGKPKTPVFAAVQRGGSVRTKVLTNVTALNLKDALLECAETSSRLVTDDHSMYQKLGKPFAKHDTVNHTAKEYVNAADPSIHTNTIEGYFSRFKRKLNGTHHAVSKKHLHRYASETAFIYNARGMNDGERVVHLLQSMEGKRLTYRESTGAE